jgi:hypothetical protein
MNGTSDRSMRAERQRLSSVSIEAPPSDNRAAPQTSYDLAPRVTGSTRHGRLSDAYRAHKDPILLAILVAAVIVRVYLAMVSTYAWDEERQNIPTALRISLHPDSFYLPIHETLHPSLPPYFVRAGALLLGETPLGFRLLAIISGVLTVLLISRIAQDMFGSTAGRVAAFLLAFNEYHIGVSALAGGHSFYLLFCALAIFCLIRFLRTERTRYLFLAGPAAGLGYLCYELTLLLIPAFFLAILWSARRPWLLRREPYLATGLFLLVIAPDLIWQLQYHGTTEPYRAGFSEHLARFGNIRPNSRAVSFYIRDALKPIEGILGRGLGTTAGGGTGAYPQMSLFFGVLLLAATTIVPFTRMRHDPGVRALLLLFWSVFLLFSAFRAVQPPNTVLAAGRTWVDQTLLPAVLLASLVVARIRGGWKMCAYASLVAAGLWAGSGVFVSHLNRTAVAVATVPASLWPPNGEMVPLEIRFAHCALCNPDAHVQLVSVDVLEGATSRPAESPREIAGATLGTDDRTFALRADPGKWYRVTYAVDDAGDSRITGYVWAPSREDTAPPPPAFWARP